MTEFQIQKAVIENLKLRAAKGVVFFAVPGGGKRSLIEAVNFKRSGVLAGVSDLIFLHASKAYALELKAERGRPSEAQLEFLDNWRAAGGYGCVANGLDRALAVLEAWGLIR